MGKTQNERSFWYFRMCTYSLQCYIDRHHGGNCFWLKCLHPYFLPYFNPVMVLQIWFSMWSVPVNFRESWGRGGVVGNVVCTNEQRGGVIWKTNKIEGGGGGLQLAKLGNYFLNGRKY